MKRKLMSVLLIATMGVSVLAGCASSDSQKTEVDKKVASSDENVLEFYHGYIRIKANGLQHR